MSKIDVSTLKEGDTFIHKGVLYEVWQKNTWNTRCRYLNDNIVMAIGGSIFIVTLVIIQKSKYEDIGV